MGSDLTTGTLPPLPLNDLLILAGTLHGIHAITARLDPAPPPGAPPAGLQSFEAEGWGGTVFLTPTGESIAASEASLLASTSSALSISFNEWPVSPLPPKCADRIVTEDTGGREAVCFTEAS